MDLMLLIFALLYDAIAASVPTFSPVIAALLPVFMVFRRLPPAFFKFKSISSSRSPATDTVECTVAKKLDYHRNAAYQVMNTLIAQQMVDIYRISHLTYVYCIVYIEYACPPNFE